MRIKRGVSRHRRHKRLLKRTSGFRGSRSKLIRPARLALERSLVYAYRDRRQKKRQMHRIWIVRINAAARLHGLSYSRLIHGLKQAAVEIDRKVLADLALRDAGAFGEIAALARTHAAA
jgi:large subunit ribosomal protein L20